MLNQKSNITELTLATITYLKYFLSTVTSEDLKNTALFQNGKFTHSEEVAAILVPQRAGLTFKNGNLCLTVHKSVLLSSMNRVMDNDDIPLSFHFTFCLNGEQEDVFASFNSNHLWFSIESDVLNHLVQNNETKHSMELCYD